MPVEPAIEHASHGATLHHTDHHTHGAACGGGHGHARPVDVRPVDPAALVSARGLIFTRGGRDLISGVDLDVASGEIVTIIGPNGAGKTTLVKLMLGIASPDRGEVFRPAGTRIGYVPQRFEVDRAIPLTVERFLELGLTVAPGAAVAALREMAPSGPPSSSSRSCQAARRSAF